MTYVTAKLQFVQPMLNVFLFRKSRQEGYEKNVSKEEAVVKCWLNNLIASHFLSFFCEEGDYYNNSILKPATSLWHFQMKVICIKLMV